MAADGHGAASGEPGEAMVIAGAGRKGVWENGGRGRDAMRTKGPELMVCSSIGEARGEMDCSRGGEARKLLPDDSK